MTHKPSHLRGALAGSGELIPNPPLPFHFSFFIFHSSFVFLLFPLLLYFPLLHGQTCLFSDLRSIHWPYRGLLAEGLGQGRFPLWTPNAACGFPLHAEGEGGFWSPV